MQGGDLDTYTTEFNRLYKLVGFKTDEIGTIELYKRGLNAGLLKSIIDNYMIKPNDLVAWQKEA